MSNAPKKILVVEDNPITRKLLRITLEGENYSVLEAHDGRTALELAEREHDVDLVLQDLLLPDMHGVDLIRELRSIPTYDSKPILAVTGLVSKLEEARALNSGFTAYLLKPIEPSKLLETVKSYLPSAEPPVEKPGRNRTILLVNDDPVGLKLEKLLLEEIGFQVTAVDNAERALDIAKASPPDAFIADLVMPGVNGIELTMLIRKQRKLKDIPVIVASSTYSVIQERDVAAAKEMGADALVLRTPKLENVIPALLDALKNKHHGRLARNASKLFLEFNHRLIHQLEVQAIHRAQELRQSALETAKLSVLTGVAEALNKHLGLDKALEEALARTLDASGVSIGAIYLTGDGGRFFLSAHFGFADPQIARVAEICDDQALLNRMFQDRKALVVSSENMKRGPLADLIARGLAKSIILVPLIAGSEPQGILLMASAKREAVDAWLDLADAVGSQLAQAILLSRTLTQLTASEQRFRELAENINEIFFVSGPDGSPVHYVSPAYEQITGRKCETLYQSPRAWLENIHPEDRPRVQQAVRDNLEGLDEEYRIVRADGDVRWLRSRAFPVRDETGSVVRIVGIAEDITERKRTEEKIQQNLERIRALHEIDTAISSTLDLSTVLTVLLEKLELFLPIAAATTVRLLNRETGELESLACRGLDEAEWKSQERRLIGGRAKWIVETKAPLAVRDLQADRRTYYGEIFRRHGLVSYLGVPLTAQDEVLGVLGIYADHEHEFSQEEIEFLNTLAVQAAIAIHNAQLFEQTKKQAQALETSNRVKDEFLSVMSHELRTPLSVIVGYAGLVKEGMLGPVNNKIADALTKVLGRAGEQLTMINDIMQTTQIESRSIAVEHLPVDIGALMDALKSDYELHMNKPSVKLLWDYPAETIEIRSDGAKLKQILQNLVNNALKFTDAGTVTVTARVTGARDRGVGAGAGSRPLTPGPRFVEFKVADRGVGIPKDTLATIFDKFYQVDSSETRLYGGVGLGLYIVKNFTELLGGTIDVESEEGKGSTFTVTLPARSAAPSGAYRLRG